MKTRIRQLVNGNWIVEGKQLFWWFPIWSYDLSCSCYHEYSYCWVHTLDSAIALEKKLFIQSWKVNTKSTNNNYKGVLLCGALVVQ